MDNENINIESAETQEVAEPETETLESAEMQEVAEPDEAEYSEESEPDEYGRTEQDAAFAEQRRRIRELERESEMMRSALGRYFNGDTAEELSINANAYADDRDPEEYRAEWEHEREFESLQSENEDLREQLLSAQVERLMQEGLRDIQVIDPSVKSLEELGDSFAHFIGAGLSSTEAYWACKAQQDNEKVQAPSAIGRVSGTQAEREYFTSEEIDDITENHPELLDDDNVWEKVMRSMGRLNK